MNINQLWPELAWIEDPDLREKTTKTWELALERSVLTPEDLGRIPFTLLARPDLKVSFMAHKRAVVHVAKESALKMIEFFGDELPINLDVVIAGAILADVGKLLEYELDEHGNSFQGVYGKYLRHPFSGVSLAEECGVPAEICHIIAAHAAEGELIKRTTEAYIVHHADFMTFLPFKSRLEVQVLDIRD
ncbi:MAG: HDIG domain-containing protein [Anaerolineales bacterium]|nr:HDIG domain-containing protein [Anaerolineales bacterium]